MPGLNLAPNPRTPHPDTTKPRPTPPHPRHVPNPLSPRALILVWCFWLLASWATTLWLSSANVASHFAWASQGTSSAGVRWMVIMAMAGLLLAWPVFRLSEANPPSPNQATDPLPPAGSPKLNASHSLESTYPLFRTLADWACLNLVFQAVIWPLKVIADWQHDQTLTLIAAALAWSALVALAIAWGRQLNAPRARLLAMLACILIVFAQPLVVAVTRLPHPDGLPFSPIGTFWAVTAAPHRFDPLPLLPALLAVAAAALAGWGFLALWSRLAKP